MKRLDEKTICMIRQIYNKGTRLELKQTDNPQAPPIGTRGGSYYTITEDVATHDVEVGITTYDESKKQWLIDEQCGRQVKAWAKIEKPCMPENPYVPEEFRKRLMTYMGRTVGEKSLNTLKSEEQKEKELKEKIDAHSKWLRNAGGERLNLDGVDLQGMDLSDIDLSKARLNGANLGATTLYGTVLVGAELEGVNFGGAKIKDTNFSTADMYSAIFDNAEITDAYFDNANLAYASFINTTCKRTNFTGAALRKVCERNAAPVNRTLCTQRDTHTLRIQTLQVQIWKQRCRHLRVDG